MGPPRQGQDVVFAGEKKLRTAVLEPYGVFRPKGIAICAICRVGLIGDDVRAVARNM